MKRSLVFASLMILIVVGCIVIPSEHTINARIVVDINIVEKQINQINDYIDGKTNALPDIAPAPQGKPEGRLHKALEWISPVRAAYAQEQQGTSEEFRQAADRRRARKPDLDALRKSGSAGENNRGYVELRAADKVPSADEKNRAQRVIADENEDRKAMYKELAKVNKKSVTTIEQLSAADLLDRGQSGECFQLPAAGEQFDAFKTSEAGKKLGAACVPEAWITLP